MKEKLKLVRKRGGRSYTYREGGNIPTGWAIEDSKGKQYKTFAEYQEANKPKPKPEAKKKVVTKDEE